MTPGIRHRPVPKLSGMVYKQGRSIPVFKRTAIVYKHLKKDTIIMSVNLSKGESVNLTKLAPALAAVAACAGWDMATEGKSMDLDLAVFALDKNDKTLNGDDGFIFFNHKTGCNNAIQHQGDNLTGEGDGDDEVINIDLKALPAEAAKLAVVAAIYNAKQKKQELTDLKNAFIRVVDKSNNTELAKFDINSGLTGDGILFGEFTKDANNEWSFKAIGQTITGEFNTFVNQYGLQAAA